VNWYPAELTRRQADDDAQHPDPWVGDGAPPSTPIVIVESDPGWPEEYERAAAGIAAALGDLVMRIEHVGSTSIAGLPAKPIVDVDVQVADSSAEGAYVPALDALGYRHVLREPWWNGHRMLVRADGGVNLHVFQLGTPEPLRHLLFRDWLRTHDDDRELYAAAKRRLAAASAEHPASYNLDKNSVIDDIYGRIFSAPPQSHPSWPVGGWTPPKTE
jgi:GrpB-like predicted nucleotidyltransferase (UPF0157 family)